MLETAERLIINEIGDYTATLPHPEHMPSAPQIHDELIARVQRVFVDVKQQNYIAEIRAQAVEDASSSVLGSFDFGPYHAKLGLLDDLCDLFGKYANKIRGQAKQQKYEQPIITVKQLHKEHWLVKAGYAMVSAHASNETLVPAVEEVIEQYPQLTRELAIAMWVAINAKSKAGA